MPIFQFFRRRRIRKKPFPENRQLILERDVPYYRKLPEDYRESLKKRMMVFMDEKLFEGCGGLEMTERIKIIISAYACLLILEETSGYYPDLQAILVYPDDYVAFVDEEDEAGIITEGTEARKGESWHSGSIVLSWRDIEENIYADTSHQNLILHEFSHQLDQQYGLTAGFSADGKVYRDDEWNRTLAGAYIELQKKVRRSSQTVLDSYGATEPAEFFSVATEAFFENPSALAGEYPLLYNMLKSFYGLNPAEFG